MIISELKLNENLEEELARPIAAFPHTIFMMIYPGIQAVMYHGTGIQMWNLCGCCREGFGSIRITIPILSKREKEPLSIPMCCIIKNHYPVRFPFC